MRVSYLKPQKSELDKQIKELNKTKHDLYRKYSQRLISKEKLESIERDIDIQLR